MIKAQRSNTTAVAMCPQETNLFFFTPGYSSIPPGTSCSKFGFRNLILEWIFVVFFEVLWVREKQVQFI